MKLRVAALLICVCMLLTSCMSLAQGTDSLMRPPKLSVEQQRIYAALSAAVGDSIVLKYPGQGEHRSAFVMYDIDNDNEEEIIVFYASSQSDDVRMNILKLQDGEWFSVYDSLGLGPEIDSISFLHITNKQQLNVVVSYEIPSIQQKVIAVYSYKDSQLVEEFVSDYNSSLIQDFDGDGLDELFLLYNAESVIAKAMYVDTLYAFGSPAVMGETELSTEVKQYVQIIAEPEYNYPSTVSQDEQDKPSSYKIYIDGVTAVKGNHTTELVRLQNRSLNNLLVNKDGLHNTNWRSVSILTQDRNNDGVMDVPKGIGIPGSPTDSKESAVALIEWYNYTDDTFWSTSYTLVNRLFGFSLDYPQKWGNNIAVRQSEDGFEWRIHRYLEASKNAEDSSQTSTIGDELLRIRVYNNNNFFDEYSSEGYQEIGKCDEFTYYAYIPETEGKNEFAITFDELLTLFHVDKAV